MLLHDIAQPAACHCIYRPIGYACIHSSFKLLYNLLECCECSRPKIDTKKLRSASLKPLNILRRPHSTQFFSKKLVCPRGRLKMRDWNYRHHQKCRVENAGLEISEPCYRGWKMRDWNYRHQPAGVENAGPSSYGKPNTYLLRHTQHDLSNF